MFNKYFHSVFINDDLDPLPNDIVRTRDARLLSVTFDKEKVENILKKLDTSKAMGPDNISAWILRQCAAELAESLAILFQRSMDEGELPEEWRTANIVPIHKKGDKTEVSNYRPVSLLCIASKIMERIIADSTFPVLKDQVYDLQHGFLKGCSTTTQLLDYFQEIGETLDETGQTDIIYLDFAKAFDTVSHRHLIAKLESFGLADNLLNWMKAYLHGRHQRVLVEGEVSNWLPVVSGVPQGSILGPLLFILFINDLPRSARNSRVALFADDAKCCRKITTIEDCRLLQQDLTRIIEWSKTWKMKFNAGKCQVLSVTRKAHKIVYNYTINGTNLEQVSSIKDLGVIINTSLTWDKHIENIINKTYRKLGMIKRSMGYHSPRETLLALYKTLVRSTLDYASQVWSPWQINQIEALERVQRRFTKYILNYPEMDYVQRLIELGLLPLSYRREIMDLTLYFKCRMGKGNNQLLVHTKTTPHCKTRRTSTMGATLYRGNCNSETFLHSFFNRLVPIWNNLPLQVRTSKSVAEFKSRIQAHYESRLANNFCIDNVCTWRTSCSCEVCRCRNLTK